VFSLCNRRTGIRKIVLTKYNYVLVVVFVFNNVGNKSCVDVFIKENLYDLIGSYESIFTIL